MGVRIIAKNKKRLEVAGKGGDKWVEVIKSGIGGNQTTICLVTSTFKQEVVIIAEKILPEDVEKFLEEMN